MFDIIKDGAVFDMGMIYSFAISGSKYNKDTAFAVRFRNLIRFDGDFSSNYAQNEELYITQLKNIADKYKEMNK